MANDDILINLRAEFDKKSEQEIKRFERLATARIDNVKRSIKESVTVSEQFDIALRKLARSRAVDAVNEQFRQSIKDGKDATKAVRDLRAELERIGASEGEIRSAAQAVASIGDQAGASATRAVGGGRGRRRNVVGNIGEALRVAPSLPLGPTSTEQISRALKGLGRLSASIGQLAAIAPIAAATVVALVVVARQFTGTINAATDAIKSVIETQKEINRIRVSGSREELFAARDAAEQRVRELERLNEIRSELNQQAIDRANEQLGFLSGGVRFLSDKLGVGPFNEVSDALDETERELNEADIALGLFNAELADSAKLASEAAAAFSNDLIDTEIQALTLAQTESFDQIQARITALQQERDAIQTVVDAGGLTAEKMFELTQRLSGLETRIGSLRNLALPPALLRKEQEDAEEAAREAVLGIFNRIRDTAQTAGSVILSTTNATSEALAKLGDATARITDQLADSIARIQDQLSERLARATQTASNAREDLEISTQEKLFTIAENAKEKLFQLERRFTRSSAQAIQDRNAVALEAATTARSDALTDLERSQDRETKTVARTAKDRLRIITRQFAQELARARDTASKAIAIARAKARQEIAQKQAETRALIAEAASKARQELGIARQGKVGVVATFANMFNDVLRLGAQAAAALRAQTTTTILGVRPQILTSPTQLVRPGGIAINPFAAGGPFRAGQNMLVGERGPEIVRFNRGGSVTPNNQIGGGTAVLNINGATERTVKVTSKQEAIKVLTEFVMQDAAAAGVL